MKKLLIACLVIGLAATTHGQKKKYAYINADAVLADMPEIVEAQKQIEAITLELAQYSKQKQLEYQQKAADFNANMQKYADLVRQDKQKELQTLQQEIQNFQLSAQQEILKKQEELYQPAKIRLRKTINDVASEQGYSWVIDNSDGRILYSDNTDDIENAVRKKLKIEKP